MNFIHAIKFQRCNEDYVCQQNLPPKNKLSIHRKQIQNPSTRQTLMSGHVDIRAKSEFPKFFPPYF